MMLFGTLTVANANHYPVLINEYTWLDGSILHDYKIYQYQPIAPDYARTWGEARSFVFANAGIGFDLATITSQAEQDQLTLHMASVIPVGNYPSITDQYWLGAIQAPGAASPSAGWSWVTGEAWNYTAWYSGPDAQVGPVNQPDDLFGLQENALGVRSSYGWMWNDYPDTGLGYGAGFIAESTAVVPEPSSLLLVGSGSICLFRSRSKGRKAPAS